MSQPQNWSDPLLTLIQKQLNLIRHVQKCQQLYTASYSTEFLHFIHILGQKLKRL
jgi:hypothetical protein